MVVVAGQNGPLNTGVSQSTGKGYGYRKINVFDDSVDQTVNAGHRPLAELRTLRIEETPSFLTVTSNLILYRFADRANPLERGSANGIQQQRGYRAQERPSGATQ